MSLRNIAIIAHVDHGKTTLVDQLLAQSGVFRANEAHAERAMDSNDQERERGITILAKCTSVLWHGAAGETRINIIDTPGHADFGGEVERILGMVDGCLLLVDAEEGVMPQTKFVLGKALKLGLQPDRGAEQGRPAPRRPRQGAQRRLRPLRRHRRHRRAARLPAHLRQRQAGLGGRGHGRAAREPGPAVRHDRRACARRPQRRASADGPAQLLAVLIEADPFLGRLLTGRVESGRLAPGMAIQRPLARRQGDRTRPDHQAAGLPRPEAHSRSRRPRPATSSPSPACPRPPWPTPCAPWRSTDALPAQPIDPPTIAITVSVNDSPLAGRDGDKVQSRVIRDRLLREAEANVAIKVAETAEKDAFEVAGRGELQLGVLIETMRREGFEVVHQPPARGLPDRPGDRRAAGADRGGGRSTWTTTTPASSSRSCRPARPS